MPVEPEIAAPDGAPPRYDKRRLSYATTFPDPWQARAIRALEWATGKLTLLQMVRRFERMGPADGQAFWAQALGIMGIGLETPADEIARLPREGPVIVVANHPHGLVDGMILAELIGRVRRDYRILTRSLLTGVSEVAEFLIPVPFPHEATARAQSIEMRARAMAHLGRGGLVALFPSGAVASSESWFGPAVEAQWNAFTGTLIQRSGASVVPVRFPGSNSRTYQIANRLSPVLRQGLLIREVVKACGVPQAPIVGAPIPPQEIARMPQAPRALVAELRARTLDLAR